MKLVVKRLKGAFYCDGRTEEKSAQQGFFEELFAKL